MDFIPVWANAVAQFEGFNSPGSRPARNHNPGNLKYAGQAGSVGKDPDNFAVFGSDDLGFQALYRQLAKYVSDFPGYSILQITAHYLGQSAPTADSQGNAFTYASYVAGQLGVDPGTTLGQLASGAAAAVGTIVDAVTPNLGPDTGNPPDPSSTGNLVLYMIGGGLFLWFLTRLMGGVS